MTTQEEAVQSIRILMIEDSEDDVFFTVKHLEKQGYFVVWERVELADEFKAALKNNTWDIILSDFKMPEFSGMEALEILNESGIDIPFIVISGAIGEETAVSMMKAGASDYILKGNFQRLIPAIEREIKEAYNRAQHRESEKAVKHYMERLEQSNKDLEQFAMVTSHDLQEPLRKIRIFTEFLEARHGDELSDSSKNYLSRIHGAAVRMQDLIAGLLDLSRVRRKGQPFTVVSLKDVISTVIRDLELTLVETQGRVEVSELCTVQADPQQMEQLFLNLIGNAFKFRRRDTSPVIQVSSQAQEGFCEIRVADNGIGFEAKYHEKLFDIFERLHDKTQYAGTGIGLAICKKIVERHNGSIQAEGQPDKGATFIIRLPLKQLH